MVGTDIVPAYAANQTVDMIHTRMLGAVPAGIDKSEGGFIWDTTRPPAILLRIANVNQIEWLRRAFVRNAFGQWLDLRAEEHGLTRLPATVATGVARFTGNNGATIPLGTLISTLGTTLSLPVGFATTAVATIPISGIIDVPIRASLAGDTGNVPAATIIAFQVPISGVTSVTNPDVTAGGSDEESDEELRDRYYLKVRLPSAGGNVADYLNWTREVSGVGGVAVVPVRDGPGTVSIAIVDSVQLPAGQALVDAVQDYIAPPHRIPTEAEDTTVWAQTGGGITTLTTQTDASAASAVNMAYAAGNAGRLTDSNINLWLSQPGVYQARWRVKASAVSGSTVLGTFVISNATVGGDAVTRQGGVIASRLTRNANQLSTTYADVTVEFYWNGADTLHAYVQRELTDTTTALIVDSVLYRSVFSRDDGAGKAPIGARVTVESATAVPITVSVHLIYESGFDPVAVRTAVTNRLVAYFREIALDVDNDVRIVRVANEIYDTDGVADYDTLLINGGGSTISIGVQQVAILETITWT
jgi:uncharacterized phage protein gp47/JayE